MSVSVDVAPDECPECGLRLWHTSHTDAAHTVRRKILMRVIRRRLWEEARFRQEAADLAQWGGVLLLWRVVLPAEVAYFRTALPGELWDELAAFRGEVLAHLGRGLRDSVERGYGIRPHPMQTKYRIFDERSCSTLK